MGIVPPVIVWLQIFVVLLVALALERRVVFWSVFVVTVVVTAVAAVVVTSEQNSGWIFLFLPFCLTNAPNS